MFSNSLKQLNNALLDEVGRSANMIWMIFRKNDQALALNIQCPCRFVSQNEILLSSGDIYCPNSSFNGDYEEFDWDIQGNNLFDEISNNLTKNHDFFVKSHKINQYGDLQICFTNDISIEVIMDNSANEEQWRFFIKGSNEEHVVATPKGITLE
ncbi:MAG TPA: hypothetical protein DEB10_10725 [Ruminococcaceae bacterium]|jgi:hypothetical protein|nr:hypothetical protein [Oscillospiraceae bacterium]